MAYSPKQYAEALYQAISETTPEGQEKILDNFVRILKEYGDFDKVDSIENEFLEYARNVSNVKVANVTSARELDASQEQKILRGLNDYIGTKVELKKKVDRGLVGGLVIKVGDELIDGSVKRSLQELHDKLLK